MQFSADPDGCAAARVQKIGHARDGLYEPQLCICLRPSPCVLTLLGCVAPDLVQLSSAVGSDKPFSCGVPSVT